MANGIISSLQIGSGDVGVFTTPYGVCESIPTDNAKVVSVTGDFVLETGARVAVKFRYENSMGTITLNVKSTGAKTVQYYGVSTNINKYLYQATIYDFVYDGTYWQLLNTRDLDTVYSHPSVSHLPTHNAGTEGSHMLVSSSDANAGKWWTNFGKAGTGTYSTIIGNLSAYNSTSKTGNTVTGEGSIAIGNGNNVTDAYSFTQGYQNSNNTGRGFISGELNTLNTTGGGFSAAFGKSNSIKGNVHHIYAFGSENTCNVTDSSAAHDCILGGYKNTLGNEDVSCGIALGYNNTVTGNAVIGPIALGQSNTSSGMGSFACGISNTASTARAIAIGGSNTASGGSAIAMGYSNTASGSYNIAMGQYCYAYSGNNNTVLGNSNTVYGTNNVVIGTDIKLGYSSSEGYYGHYCTFFGRGHQFNKSSSTYRKPLYMTVIGRYANYLYTGQQGDTSTVISNTTGDTGPYLFQIGNGTSTSSGSSALRVNCAGGVAIGGSLYQSASADYAECFEWSDGNVNKEDRRGRFVTFDKDETIRYATEEDDYVLGIISATPSIVGDCHDQFWQGRHKKDVYGKVQYEDYEIPAEYDEETGEEICPATIVPKPIDSENYDPDREYIPRLNRPEWTIVGLLGKLIVDDDGTCEVNGYAKPGKDGIATKGTRENGYRVIARIDENHIKVLFK